MELDSEAAIILAAAADLDDDELAKALGLVYAAKWHLSRDVEKRDKAHELLRARRDRKRKQRAEQRRTEHLELLAQLSAAQALDKIGMVITPWVTDELGNLSRLVYCREDERVRKQGKRRAETCNESATSFE
jgi:hypothetical protein